MFDDFFQVEEIDCDYKCSSCKKKTSIKKYTEIAVLPSILVLHIKRFNGFSKNSGAVIFSENLNLKKYVVQRDFEDGIKEEYSKSCSYELIAVAEHIGYSSSSGHYVSYCKRNSKWYKCNDNNVIQISEDDCTSKSAYVIFYRRKK